jgi:hypothetical protein
MQAMISVFHQMSPEFPNPNKPMGQYYIDVESPEQLEQEYQEVRKVWAEYQVEIKLGSIHKGSSQTYKEELFLELNN